MTQREDERRHAVADPATVVEVSQVRDQTGQSQPSPAVVPGCSFCGVPLRYTFVDLGMSPLANGYLKAGQLTHMEKFYPLHAYVCDSCFLVQLKEFEKPEHIFDDYLYFSSFSDTWLEHARSYVEMVIKRFGINRNTQVVEVASNDGYLLQYFAQKHVPVLGVEPAANVAGVAREKGVPTLVKFFSEETAVGMRAEGIQADLLIGNNVLAHVPNLRSFVQGLKILLSSRGVLTLEFPHLLRLMADNQFDTVYHEHFSYFSFLTAERVLSAFGLTVFDVEKMATHGGSLRIFACHAEDRSQERTSRVDELRDEEEAAGMTRLESYLSFAEKVREAKRKIMEFLINTKREGKTIVGYGAPAKGNTLLNYCGIRSDFIEYTVDRSPHKQGHYLPGTHIPIFHPDTIAQTKPDYVVILPWNLKEEIILHLSYLRAWGGKFVVLIPEVTVYS